jgi:hypothetical protein
MTELEILAKQIPNHIIIEKCLWAGNVSVDINHVDNDPSKPLDYVRAFKEMIEKLCITTLEGIAP